MIIIVLGLPGSGKSYFAQALAKRIDAAYVNSDRVRNAEGARGKYQIEDKMRIYHLMAEETQKYAMDGQDVVVDGTFYLGATIDLFNALASSLGTTVFFVCVVADE